MNMINVTVKVEGPTGSGKSLVMSIILEALRNTGFALTNVNRTVSGSETVKALKEV